MHHAAVGLVLLTLFAGCQRYAPATKADKQAASNGKSIAGENTAEDPAATTTDVQPPVAPMPQPVGPPPSGTIADLVNQPAGATPPTADPSLVVPSDPPPTTARHSRLVRLSLGTALAQTLPDGTAMGFSVEYEFLAEPPAGSPRFALLIRDGRGQALLHPVPRSNKREGTIAFFATQWKPDQAPFKAVLVMATGNSSSQPVSNVVDLR